MYCLWCVELRVVKHHFMVVYPPNLCVNVFAHTIELVSFICRLWLLRWGLTDGSLITRIHNKMRVGERWTHWISSLIHVQNRSRGWNRNVYWWLQAWVTHPVLRRNKWQRIGKVFVRARAHWKIVPNVTRDFRNNQFASLSIQTVLPNNVSLTMTMMCPTKVDTWSITHVRTGSVNVIVIQIHGTKRTKCIYLFQRGSWVVV